MLNPRDRRAAKRVGHICEVECFGSGINRLATRITDLSTTGAFIDSMTCFAPGTILHLKFRVKDMAVETDCQVRYSMQQMGMGVQFIDLKPEYLAILEYFIDGKPLAPPPAPEPPPAPTPVPESIPAPVAAPAASMLLGNFAVVSLFDVIQIVENNRLTGALVITSLAAKGEIHFTGGQIVGSQAGITRGQDALIMFLDVTEGTFVFNGADTDYPRTIQASSNMGLMLDLLRIKDEEAAFQ